MCHVGDLSSITRKEFLVIGYGRTNWENFPGFISTMAELRALGRQPSSRGQRYPSIRAQGVSTPILLSQPEFIPALVFECSLQGSQVFRTFLCPILTSALKRFCWPLQADSTAPLPTGQQRCESTRSSFARLRSASKRRDRCCRGYRHILTRYTTGIYLLFAPSLRSPSHRRHCLANPRNQLKPRDLCAS